MEYKVAKIINNNVVLAREIGSNESVMLMSKGIGFHKKQNDIVSDSGDGDQVFKLWSDAGVVQNITYDKEMLDDAILEIAQNAHNKLNINKDELIKPLLDHIIFAIDRMNFGLPSDNPFQEETYVLYAGEYEVAKDGVDLIRTRLGIDMGESEIGYIAIHLNSVRRKRPISTSLEHVRMYNEISNLIKSTFERKIDHDFDVKTFLMSLAGVIQMDSRGVFFNMPCKEDILPQIGESYSLTKKIAALIQKEMQLALKIDSIAFIAIDIEKLRQIYNHD